MPDHFFDTIGGAGLNLDDTGLTLPDDHAARQHGLDCLPDMARDEMPDGDRRIFSVIVRDSARYPIYVADLNLSGKWLSEAGEARP